MSGKGKRTCRRASPEDSLPRPKVILKFIGFIVLSCQNCYTRSHLNHSHLFDCYPPPEGAPGY